MIGPRSFYYAFWADAAEDFRPRTLFAVDPGDRMEATLRQTDGKWTVQIADATSHATTHFSTTAGGRATFGVAQWLDEDLSNEATGRRFAFPDTSRLRFEQIAVNGKPPAYAQLYSTWMSLGHTDLAPEPLRDDAFDLQRVTMNPSAERFLLVARREDAAIEAFNTQTMKWRPSVPSPVLRIARKELLPAVKAADRQFSNEAWPTPAAEILKALVASDRNLIGVANRAEAVHTQGGLSEWRAAWAGAAQVGADLAHRVRRALRAPELDIQQ